MAGNGMGGGKQPSPKKQKAVEDAAPVPSPVAASSKQLALPAPSDFEPKKRKTTAGEATKPEQNAPAASEAAVADAPAASEAAAADGNDFENAAFKALLEREEGKKASAKAKAASKPKAKASAKSKTNGKTKTAPVMKRPSSKALDFTVVKPTAGDLEKDANVYHSRIWHQAKQFALKVLMMQEKPAKVYAKSKRAEANKFWITAKQ